MEKLEKCIRFEKQAKPLMEKYNLTYMQCIQLRNELFQDFVESLNEYYLEIDIDAYIKWIKSQVSRLDSDLPHRKEDEKKAD